MRDLLHEVPAEADAEELARLFAVLAHPVRLRIIAAVACGEASTVTGLTAAVDRTDCDVRHHLDVLMRAGVLSRGRRTPHQHAVVPEVLGRLAGALGVFR